MINFILGVMIGQAVLLIVAALCAMNGEGDDEQPK